MIIPDSASLLHNRHRGDHLPYVAEHGKYKSYLYRFGLTNESKCDLCVVNETPPHVLQLTVNEKMTNEEFKNQLSKSIA